MIHVRAVRAKNINIVMVKDFKIMRRVKIFLALNLILILISVPAYAMRTYEKPSGLPPYDIQQMRRVNPDFSTYPDDNGIIWLKSTNVTRHENGGMEITRLYIILCRKNIDSKWLTWNIQIPRNGNVNIMHSSLYDFASDKKIRDVKPVEQNNLNIIDFNGELPENFIILIAWKEILPEHISFDGVCWLQEDLRIWENLIEITSQQALNYVTFPQENLRPIVQNSLYGTVYTWRKINSEAFNPLAGLSKIQRSGIAYGNVRNENGLKSVFNRANDSSNVKPTPEITKILKGGTKNFIDWLKSEPNINLAESNSRRNIPNSGGWSKSEKLILANSWLNNTEMRWALPYEPEKDSPLSEALFYEPVIEFKKSSDPKFKLKYFSLNDPVLMQGVKIYSVSNEGRLTKKSIPISKSSANKLNALMDLKLDENGILNGNVKLNISGGWNNILSGTPEEILYSLFPGLTHYENLKIQDGELNFKVVNRPGIAGTGRGILAILPFFEPVMLNDLANTPPTIELKFPFVLEININLSLPKNAKEALVSGKILPMPDKINYSENYLNRRHKLEANARLEINMPVISIGNMSLLRRNIILWHNFVAKNIPVR